MPSSRGSTPRAGAADDRKNDLRAVEGGDGTGEAVPGVLAHQQRGAPPRRIERTHVASPLDESLFVEQPVGWEEHLAVHMVNHRAGRCPECHIHRAVVQGALPLFVKADDDIERAGRRDRRRHGATVGLVQLARHCPGGTGGIPHPAFEEIPGERGLGELKDPWSNRIGSVERGEQRPETRQILRESSFTGTELGQRDGQRRRHITHSS